MCVVEAPFLTSNDLTCYEGFQDQVRVVIIILLMELKLIKGTTHKARMKTPNARMNISIM